MIGTLHFSTRAIHGLTEHIAICARKAVDHAGRRLDPDFDETKLPDAAVEALKSLFGPSTAIVVDGE